MANLSSYTTKLCQLNLGDQVIMLHDVHIGLPELYVEIISLYGLRISL